MARGINKVILIGNLGSDPQVRYTQTGVPMCAMSLATTDAWKDKQTGEYQDRTEWHRLVFFYRLAEIAGEYLRKGSKVYIEGSLRTRKWLDKNGTERYTTEVIVGSMQMLDSRAGSNSGLGLDQSSMGNAEQSMSDYPMADEPQNAFVGDVQNEGDGNANKDFDDDIPF